MIDNPPELQPEQPCGSIQRDDDGGGFCTRHAGHPGNCGDGQAEWTAESPLPAWRQTPADMYAATVREANALRIEGKKLEHERDALRADQGKWRKGVELIASALGESNPPNLCCVRIAEVALTLRAELERAEAARGELIDQNEPIHEAMRVAKGLLHD